MIELSGFGVGEWRWLAERGSASVDGARLKLEAPARSDWFSDPMSGARHASAPALVFTPAGDFQLSAQVKVGFASAFDAGVLFVHVDADRYAKLCFEYSPDGEPMVVSVVTRTVSDDANGPIINGNRIFLRVSRIGETFAFHHSADGERWALTRLFSIGPDAVGSFVGFLAQSPTGDGCQVTFSNVRLDRQTLADVRDGS
ncbi:MAG: DUF1349 domain-containing protein [Actinomycetota bacterium]